MDVLEDQLKRSGRVKCKGPVIKENTVDDAYSVEDESSGDDFVKTTYVKRKDIELDDNGKKGTKRDTVAVKKRKKSDIIGDDNEKDKKVKRAEGESSSSRTTNKLKRIKKKRYVFQTRTNPKALYNAIVTLKLIQKACLVRIGFANVLEFKCDGIPSKMGFYVVDNFSQHNMEIKLNERSIEITQESISEMLGIRNEGVDIMEEEDANDEEVVKNWVDRFEEGKDITPSAVKFLIRKSKVADMNFKLNFIVLFTSVMGSVKPKGICDLNVLNKSSRKTELEKINWCKYVWRCLKTCKDEWKQDKLNSYFLGPITYLTMMYVDGTVCNELNVGRKRPPTSFWTTELLKERECEEIKAGGFGNGELQGPFVEEEGDPMPEDEDRFLWKLNKYVENIRKERNGFERTFAATDLVFRGNTLIADVYQHYRETLNYKDGSSEGKSCSKMSANNNEEPHEVCTLQKASDTTSKDYDSPVFAMGQATQKEVFTMVDKVVDEFHSSTKQNDFEAPSFSLGVTQDFEMVLSKDLGNARGKRKYTKSQVARSPFRSRVTDINVAESKEEKKVETYLLKKIGLDQSEVLFETETGTMASSKQMESLVNGENIDDGVVDAWCEFLNSLESLRSENSMSRFFLPTYTVDKKLFGMEAKANESVTKFLLDVEKVNERVGRKSIIKQVDLYPAVNLIDSKNNLTKDGYIKSMVVTNTNDMVVATVLQKGFGEYLVRLNHNKAADVLKVEVKRENFYWQTDKKPYDSGVFLMRHMEAYMGNVMSKWECGLEAEGKKQNTQLGRLRKRYVVTLLLSDCNLHRDSIRAKLNDIEVANVPGKRMKLPRVGK
ncbi:hypothetical protein Tco_1023855 [Tanacetum coccineum]